MLQPCLAIPGYEMGRQKLKQPQLCHCVVVSAGWQIKNRKTGYKTLSSFVTEKERICSRHTAEVAYKSKRLLIRHRTEKP